MPDSPKPKPESEPRFDKKALQAFPERMLYWLCKEEVKERCEYYCKGLTVSESEQFLCYICQLLRRLCVRW